VASRKSTLCHAISAFGDRLVENGSHDELLRRQGLYAYLHAQQLEG
jgi:ABC-type multidrug transport system fused ATPase/permease subunit